MSSAGIKKEYRTRGKVCIALDRMIEGCFCFVVLGFYVGNWVFQSQFGVVRVENRLSGYLKRIVDFF